MSRANCLTCSHPSVASIDVALQRVGNIAAVARLYGLGRMSVARHRENHVRIQPQRPFLAIQAHVTATSGLSKAYDRGITPEQLVAEGTEPDLVELTAGVIDTRDLEFADWLGEFLAAEDPAVKERFIASAEASGMVRADDYQLPDGTWALRTKPRMAGAVTPS